MQLCTAKQTVDNERPQNHRQNLCNQAVREKQEKIRAWEAVFGLWRCHRPHPSTPTAIDEGPGVIHQIDTTFPDMHVMKDGTLRMTATTKESYSKNAKSSSAIENERPNIIKKTRVPILP